MFSALGLTGGYLVPSTVSFAAETTETRGALQQVYDVNLTRTNACANVFLNKWSTTRPSDTPFSKLTGG